MDNKKDTQNNLPNPIGQDSIGQPENLVKIMEFANSFVSFSYKRAEQVGLAIYMVTDCFDEKEPLRESMRDLTLDIIAEIHVLHGLPPFEAFMHFEVLSSRLNELSMLVRIASGSGMLTSNNSEILLKEISFFDSVLNYVREKRGSGHKGLDGRVSLSIPMQSIFEDEETDSKNPNVLDTKNETKKDIPSFLQNTKKTEHVAKDNTKDSTQKLSRRNSIIKVIHEKKSVTIKDIMSVISDCSEKTIQRELVSLMKEGILKREGEKRWAKYSIK